MRGRLRWECVSISYSESRISTRFAPSNGTSGKRHRFDLMASGIRDKVAILGMGCSKFGERWDCGPDDLIVEACSEALLDAGIERDQIGAAWLGVFFDERSEEHTSELQSPCNLVCRLLLEKK